MDYVPLGEPLPEGLREMAERVLDAQGAPPQAPPPDDVLALIAADLVATLGWTDAEAIDVVASVGTVYEPDPQLLAFQAAEEVQQWLHDSFLDTSWPQCPSHPDHPLWLSEVQPFTWHCRRDDVAVAPLGRLDEVLPAPTLKQAAAARARLHEERRSIHQMIERFAPALRRRLSRSRRRGEWR